MSDEYFSEYPGLDFERRPPGILWITINRPERLNATDAELHNGLSRVWLDIGSDDDTRVAVITGAGEAFSAGGDLAWIQHMTDDYDALRHAMTEAGDIVFRMADCRKPIISAINGVAVGAGLAVAIMADISIMAIEASITDGHVRLGVSAGDHANICWPLMCGLAKAKYYLLTADFISGEEADRIGLVSKSVPRAELHDEAMRVATKLAELPRDAVEFTKRSLNLWMRQATPAFDASLAFEMLAFRGPDAREGAAALIEKRKPDFPSRR
jgi:enoyl-CoA hydratase